MPPRRPSANLRRFVLVLHFCGQVTCERIIAILNGMGVVISKRQVVRLLTARLETFRAEDAAVLQAGLAGPDVTVDDIFTRLPVIFGARMLWRDLHYSVPPMEKAWRKPLTARL